MLENRISDIDLKNVQKDLEMLSARYDECLKNPDNIRFEKQKELFHLTEKVSQELYLKALFDRYPDVVDKRFSEKFRHLKKEIKIYTASDFCIQFRIPLLPTKSEEEEFYEEMICYIFQMILEQRGYLPQIASHNISFLHVYPVSYYEDFTLIRDEHLVTRVLWAIKLHIAPIGAGKHWSYESATVFSDEVSPGTIVQIKCAHKFK